MAKKKKVSQLTEIERILKFELSVWGERLAVNIDDKINAVENRLNARIGKLEMEIEGFEKGPNLHLDDVENFLDEKIETKVELLKDRTNSAADDIDTKHRNLGQRFKENISGVECSLDKKIGEVAGELDAKVFGLDCKLSEKIDERFNTLEEKYFELRLHNAMEPLRSLSRNIGSFRK